MNDSIKHDKELSLLDVYVFLKSGWKTIVVTVIITSILGMIIAFVLPEKYEAKAQIEPAKAVGNIVENIHILSEKMHSATYYDKKTAMTCGYHEKEKVDVRGELVKALKPHVGRQSNYVSISFKGATPTAARLCIEAVLNNVKNNQDLLTKPIIEKQQLELNKLEQQLRISKIQREQERQQDIDRLVINKQKLAAAEKFVADFQRNALRFNFSDHRFSASSLLVSILLSKQAEIKELQLQIKDLEMKIGARVTDQDNKILELTQAEANIKSSLESPQTHHAQLATPIYTPLQSIEPKRLLIIAISILAGGSLAIVLLLVRRAHRE